MLTFFKVSRLLIFLLFLANNSFGQSPDPVHSKNGMVVSASKIASEVGIQILKKGGNAVDAAVAVGFALAVTYPSAGNLGGGGFMVIHLQDGRNITIDFREKAPGSAFKQMYLDSLGNVIPKLSEEGALSVGVPGSVAGLIYALENYGTMPLSEVVQPAIELASDGFILDFRTAESFNRNFSDFSKYESTKKIFTKSGEEFYEGELFVQSDLANTLTLIRDQGLDGFYRGKTAGLIVEQINSLGGNTSLEDLQIYKPVERIPVMGSYRGYDVISMGPPSAGGLMLIQMLNILENYQFNKDDWGSSEYLHRLISAMKFAFADRSVHIGDEDFYPVPKQWILSKSYADSLFRKIKNNAIPSIEILPGTPFEIIEGSETTHYSVYDSLGNAVSTTTTINSAYGSKIVVEGAGFLLNNEMDDFSIKPGFPNQFGLLGNEANSVQPQKRMLSSMTPTIVLKDSLPFLILGSPGGSTIITVVLQVIMNVIDFGMDIQEAIDKPRIHHQLFPDEIFFEKFGLSNDLKNNLIEKGYAIGNEQTLGRVEGILIDNIQGMIYGATDPRGFGGAAGY
ncbi:MAG: gamma-glutamyltransferase [Ignavibacteriaceae bacterium]|nr:gamma-glutamyltransferase [Ignavibacteriaceae bacterium]